MKTMTLIKPIALITGAFMIVVACSSENSSSKASEPTPIGRTLATPHFQLLKQLPQLTIPNYKKEVCLRRLFNYSNFKYGFYEPCEVGNIHSDPVFLVNLETQKVISRGFGGSEAYGSVAADSTINIGPFLVIASNFGPSVYGMAIFDLSLEKEVFFDSDCLADRAKVFPQPNQDYILLCASNENGPTVTAKVHKISGGRFFPNIATYELDEGHIVGGTENTFFYETNRSVTGLHTLSQRNVLTGKVIKEIETFSTTVNSNRMYFGNSVVAQQEHSGGPVKVWNLETGNQCQIQDPEFYLQSESLQTNGSMILKNKRIAITTATGTNAPELSEVPIYDLNTCESIGQVDAHLRRWIYGEEGFAMTWGDKIELRKFDGSILDSLKIPVGGIRSLNSDPEARILILNSKSQGASVYTF